MSESLIFFSDLEIAIASPSFASLFLEMLTIFTLLIIFLHFWQLWIILKFFDYFDNDSNKDNPRDFETIRTLTTILTIENLNCELTIKSDTGQHSQFLRKKIQLLFCKTDQWSSDGSKFPSGWWRSFAAKPHLILPHFSRENMQISGRTFSNRRFLNLDKIFMVDLIKCTKITESKSSKNKYVL